MGPGVRGVNNTDLILRSLAKQAYSKDGHNAWTRGHPSRRARRARSSSDNGEAVTRDEVGDIFHTLVRRDDAVLASRHTPIRRDALDLLGALPLLGGETRRCADRASHGADITMDHLIASRSWT